MLHTDLLENMLHSFGIDIEEIQPRYDPQAYIHIHEWISYIQANSDDLLHHIARMEVIENNAKDLFDKMVDIYAGHTGDKRFITHHQAIESDHAAHNDDMAAIYQQLHTERMEELETAINTYSTLRNKVLDDFYSMRQH